MNNGIVNQLEDRCGQGLSDQYGRLRTVPNWTVVNDNRLRWSEGNFQFERTLRTQPIDKKANSDPYDGMDANAKNDQSGQKCDGELTNGPREWCRVTARLVKLRFGVHERV